MSRRDIINTIDTLNRRIAEHREKIRRSPGDRTIAHWQTEIRAFEKEKEKWERDLTVAQSRMHCPNCRREVSLNGNKCSICRMAIDG
jgi:hypothetical protein